ncbi:MAG: lysylphosphatidylglycerol synthase transmembrane domain-containing protein [Chitinophagales bacterium]
MNPLLKKTKAYIRSILGVAISLLLLSYTLHSSGLELSQIQFNTSSIVNWVLAVFVFIFTIIVHALRTKFIWVNNTSELSKIRSYSSLIIGNFYNSVLPGNLGEGVRAWHFHKKNQVSFSCSLAAIVTEKFIDAQVFLLLVVPLLCYQEWIYTNPIFITLALVSTFVFFSNGILLLGWLYPKIPKFVIRSLPLGSSLRFSLWRLFLHFKNHLRQLYKNRLLWVYIAAAICLFVLNMFQYFWVLRAANVLPLLRTLCTLYLLSCIMIVVGVVPSAPSSAGVVHYSIYASLLLAAGFLSVPVSLALKQNFALVTIYLHLSYFIPEILLGVFYLWRERKILFERYT